MGSINYFLRIAFQNVMRSGQRGIVALLCIAFGVMSLVAMLLVSESIGRFVTIEPRQQLGGDLALTRTQQETISPEQLMQLQALQTRGVIDGYTPLAPAPALSLTFRTPPSAQLKFVTVGMGVMPQTYPLVGTMTFAEPRDGTFAELLTNVGDVIVTRDIASANQLHVGDSIILSDLAKGIPVTGHVRGILYDTPSHQGGTMFYNLATADQLVGARSLEAAFVTTKNVDAAKKELAAGGWDTFSAQEMVSTQKQSKDLMDLLLKGAGVLALLVGGIGIANTMQVLLQRRRKEVAIWKTLGYTTRDLYALFAAEAALFGIAGSVLGAGAGLLVSSGLVDLFGRTTQLLFVWTFSPLPLFVGTLAGIVTTILFALWAIVLVSRVPPMSLLRNETLDAAQGSWWRSAGLAFLLAIPFTLLTSWIMGSPLNGVGVLVFAMVGMAILAVILGSLGWLATRFLPFGLVPLLNITRNSLRRRGASLLFAMMALFVGVIALAFGFVFTENAQRALDARTLHVEGYNMVIIAPASQQAAITRAVGAVKTATLAHTSVRAIHGTGEYAASTIPPEVVSATEPYNYRLEGAAWGKQPDGVYAPISSPIPTGSEIVIVLPDKSEVSKTIVGKYGFDKNPTTLWTSTGLLMPADGSDALGTPDSLRVYAEVDPSHIPQIADELPDTTLIDIAAYAARFSQTYQNLFILAVAMAGLALLAGMLLIANAVSLAMLERRYEIGVLKTVGYTWQDVLVTLAVEYGIIALLVSVVGVGIVQLFLFALGFTNSLAARLLMMDGRDIVIICAATLVLTLATVLGVVWHPTRAAPIFILNDRA